MFCPSCGFYFTFELGHLLDEGIDPTTLRSVRERCTHCDARVEIEPHEVYEL